MTFTTAQNPSSVAYMRIPNSTFSSSPSIRPLMPFLYVQCAQIRDMVQLKVSSLDYGCVPATFAPFLSGVALAVGNCDQHVVGTMLQCKASSVLLFLLASVFNTHTIQVQRAPHPHVPRGIYIARLQYQDFRHSS